MKRRDGEAARSELRTGLHGDQIGRVAGLPRGLETDFENRRLMFPRPTQRDRIKTNRNGSAGGTRQDGSRQDADRGGLIETAREGELERLPTTCFVLLAPKRPRNDQPVTNEGGLIRFALGGRSDRDAGLN